nr:excinuclease ABC subunit C [Thermoleophilaceae bacterium]
MPGTAESDAPKTRAERVLEQRRGLPDSPGVYVFKDAKNKVLYVGKAKSIKKRVGGHFSKSHVRGEADMLEQTDRIEFVATETETEALLSEQEFIRRLRPRFNIRLRDDKSYPFIAISLDEEYPRVYFTREKHRRNRAYFGPFSNAKKVRETLDLLGKVFQYRTCEGKEPGRLSGSPCLEYHINRCQAPCIDVITKEEYRENIDTIIAFLSGRYRQIERELTESMKLAAADQEFEAAAGFRNRLRAVRSLLERQRVANETVGTLDAIAVAAEGTDANAQVFQVRDGVLADRQSFYLENAAAHDESQVLEEFVLQYYASAMAIPPQVIIPRGLTPDPSLAAALSERRGGAVEVRSAERGDKRRILELAERNARLALDQDRLRHEHRRNRLRAVRSLLERQRISNEAVGTLDAIAVAVEDADANAQVFQVRDGVLSDRQSFYLLNEAGREVEDVAEEFILQYYASAMAIPTQLVVQRGVGEESALAEVLAQRRGGPVELRHAERGDKKRILDLAERNARLALDQDRLRNERRRTARIDALEGLQD